MKLLIVESPTKAKTLVKYLSGFKVIASMGHILDLPEDDLGVDIEHAFKPTYQVIEGKEKIIAQIKKESQAADEIYIGSDPDREGEAIAFHIAAQIGKKEARRVLFHEITKSGVQKALKEYSALNENLYNAQQARRVLDRIVGYKLSPFLWKSVKKGLSAGRVQSVALKLIVDREREIRAFVPEEYWTLKSIFKTAAAAEIEATLELVAGEKRKIRSAAEADEVEKMILAAKSWNVAKVEKSRKKENPAPPFNTSSLQQEASKKHHYPADKIMKLAQALYEGKEIGDEGPVGLITYMRTDSFRVSEEANAKLRGFIVDQYGKDYLSPFVRTYQNKKGKIQDAHEAIRPTDPNLTPDKVKPYLSKDELNVYTLIWRRFVASQMKEAEFEQTTVSIEDNGKKVQFKRTGSVLVFEGYRKIADRSGKDETIPAVEPGMPLTRGDLSKEQNFTKPPSRFSEGSLVKELEEKGIGRPSTYATIINHIISRKYVDRLKEPRGALGSTDLGEIVSDTLQKFFPGFINIGFTAGMEEKLDNIEEGEAVWTDVLKDFWGDFDKNLGTSLSDLKEEGKQKVYAEEPCPRCGARLVMRFSKKGNQPFLSCEKYPECDYSGDFEKVGEKVHLKERQKPADELLDEKCPKCGAQLVIKRGRFGPFKACSAYPACKTIVREEAQGFGPCPKPGCDGHIEKRRSKKGKTFYGCTKYPTCDFVSWYPPIDGAKCPLCGGAYVVEKKRGKSCEVCKKDIPA